MKITFLGTGNAFAPARDWNTILVNDAILLDVSPTALVSLKRLRIDPAGITHIFITHFHGDHFFGLPFLLLEYYFISRTEAPLHIIGPAGIEDKIRTLMETAYPGTYLQRGWPRPMTFTEVSPGQTQCVDGQYFTAIEEEHTDHITAYGYRLHLPEGVLAYTGDAHMTDALYDLVEGVRVAILEASSDEHSPVHLGKNALRELIRVIPPEAAIFLTHLDMPDSDAWRDLPATVPEDRESFVIEG